MVSLVVGSWKCRVGINSEGNLGWVLFYHHIGFPSWYIHMLASSRAMRDNQSTREVKVNLTKTVVILTSRKYLDIRSDDCWSEAYWHIDLRECQLISHIVFVSEKNIELFDAKAIENPSPNRLRGEPPFGMGEMPPCRAGNHVIPIHWLVGWAGPRGMKWRWFPKMKSSRLLMEALYSRRFTNRRMRWTQTPRCLSNASSRASSSSILWIIVINGLNPRVLSIQECKQAH